MSQWQAHKDKATGLTFYLDVTTMQTTWECPEELKGLVVDEPAWVKHLDPSTSNYFYANIKNGATSWERPEDYKSPESSPKTTKKKSSVIDGEKKRSHSRGASLAAPLADGKVRIKGIPKKSATDYSRHLDMKTGWFYYVNKNTKAVQWNVPSCWARAEDKVTQKTQSGKIVSRPRSDADPPYDALLEAENVAAAEAAAEAVAMKKAEPAVAAPALSPVAAAEPATPEAPKSMGKKILAPPTTAPPAASRSMAPPQQQTPQAALPPQQQQQVQAPKPVFAPPILPPPVMSVHEMKPGGVLNIENNPFLAKPGHGRDKSIAMGALLPQASMGNLGTGGGGGGGLSSGNYNNAAASKGASTKALPQDILADIHAFSNSDFAKKAFREGTSGKGLIKKKVPVTDVLKWQGDPISTSILESAKKFNAQAVQCFKRVQGFMGDIPSKKNDSLLANSIVEVVVKTPAIRDELFCQIIKQTTDNPNHESCLKGFVLMLTCCSVFSPSRGFQDFLINYLNIHCKNPDRQILNCCRMAKHLVNLGLRENGLKDKTFTIAQSEAVAQNGIKSPAIMFGASLDWIMELQKQEKPALGLEHPEILSVLCDQITKHGASTTKGIFRLAADRDETIAFQKKIEAGDYSFTGLDNPHTPGDLLKIWLRALNPPIFPEEMYDEAIRSSLYPEECEALALRIPPTHLKALDYLLRWLAELAKSSEITSMTEDNLAIVFCSNVLRSSGMDSGMLLKNSGAEKRFISTLIKQWAHKPPGSVQSTAGSVAAVAQPAGQQQFNHNQSQQPPPMSQLQKPALAAPNFGSSPEYSSGGQTQLSQGYQQAGQQQNWQQQQGGQQQQLHQQLGGYGMGSIGGQQQQYNNNNGYNQQQQQQQQQQLQQQQGGYGMGSMDGSAGFQSNFGLQQQQQGNNGMNQQMGNLQLNNQQQQYNQQQMNNLVSPQQQPQQGGFASTFKSAVV